ncbi:MAG: hypothetical protein M5R41_06805 [Bacteroidia bacterium]|nr:hypothetical protein [Bacteroidia bacterium]
MRICDAIKNMQTLSFTYNGYRRVVEPHTYGTDTKGHEALRAYQTSGSSESGELGWKLFHVGDIRGLSVLEATFPKPRPGYKRGDKGFSSIRCQL